MISRDWLTRWFTTNLEAVSQTDLPVSDHATRMSQELMEKWLAQEAAFWMSASQKPTLSMTQRTMRIQVSRFYADRLASIISTSRTRDTTPEETS